MDRERTRSTPGTRLTASSIGRVTPKTSWRAPKDEPCATTTTRGKASSGVDGGREDEGRPDAGPAEDRDGEVDEASLAREDVEERHGFAVTTLAPSSTPYAPYVTTVSPAATPFTISTSVAVRMPTVTGRACATPALSTTKTL